MQTNRLNLRNVIALAACLAGFTVFWGCGKDNEPNGNGNIEDNVSKITATDVINSSSYIVTVKVEMWSDEEGHGSGEIIAQAPYKNNGFTLELPATVSDKYMYLLGDAPNGITISDKTAKCSYGMNIDAYDSYDDYFIGRFRLTDYENSDGMTNTSGVMWYYVDKNVTIKGESKKIEGNKEYIGKYDMDLKKGWNVVYSNDIENYDSSTGIYVDTYTATTHKPSELDYQWYYYSYGWYWPVKAGAKSLRPAAFAIRWRGYNIRKNTMCV
ncbi:MAG: hypothetical protein FWD66_06850 [Paludibacter sp.]|nr:hypothetical protein [Paludibacter sp.]